jgi:hypothetical protein
MKEKILAAIKAKFPAINLSKKRLEAIAAKIEEKVIDDESKIDAALTTYNEYNPLAEIASTDDKIRTAEKKAKESQSAAKDDPKDKKDEPVVTTESVSDDPVMAMLKEMRNELQTLKAEKAQSTIKSKAAEALKDVPEKFWNKRALPSKDDELEAFVADVTADYQEFSKDMTAKGLSLPVPRSGTPPQGNGKGVDPSLKAAMEKMNAGKTATATPTAPVSNPYIIDTPKGV